MVWRLFSIHRNFEPDAALAAIEAEQLSAGNPLPADATGEICLRGPKVTKGYWKDPERTASAFFG